MKKYICSLNNTQVIKWLKTLFNKKKIELDPMKYLVVGLGNMGGEYDNTRHNIGFDVVDYLAESKEVEFEQDRLGDIAKVKHRGRTIILLKPSTFMNLSGKAVRYWCQKEKIIAKNLLVVTDDLNLPLGKLRLRKKGKDGGHNGLKDIIAQLGTDQYARLRLGIGREFNQGGQVDYVLGKWTRDEEESRKKVVENASKAVLSYAAIGAEQTMNTFNN